MRDTLEEMNPKAIPNQICILWHHQDAAPSDALIRALSKRGFAVMPTSSMHTVFAAACHYSKGTRTVSNRVVGAVGAVGVVGVDRVLGVVVVFDDRDSLPDADSVLDALERFAPSTLCWEHLDGMNPPMVPIVRRVEEEESIKKEPSASFASSASSAQLSPDRRAQQSPRALRLVGESEQSEQSGSDEQVAQGGAQEHKRRAGPISSRDVLDADELDALLAGELGDEKRGKGSRRK